MEAESQLAKQAQQKELKKATFTRWANKHLRTINRSIDNLETDLSDGVRLIALVGVLSQKQLRPQNYWPSSRKQKWENVAQTLKFLKDEGIKLNNIDALNIVDCNLKLIMDLIWTLILHYSISMPVWDNEQEQQAVESGQTPKQRLLAWIQMKIPNMSINNFTEDWVTGRPVGALVDACASGSYPKWKLWDPETPVLNTADAMTFANDWLDVRQLIQPEDLVNGKLDEQSVMTYLAQYPSCKLKDGAPLRPKSDPNSYFPVIEEAVVAIIDPVIESTPAEVYPGYEPTPAEVHPGIEAVSAEHLKALCQDEPAIITMETLSINEDYHFTEIAQPCKGSTFLITGLVGPGYRFQINFVHGNKTRDIALHITPSPEPEEIIFNTLAQDSWGREERPTARPFMFLEGDRFAIQVLVTQTCYLIAINGHHFSQYSHRIPYELVRSIELKGDVTEVRIQSSMVREYPQSYQELAQAQPQVYIDVMPTYYFAGGTLSEGDIFRFTGIIDKNCERFEINFMCSNESDDIAYHLQTRFSEKVIVHNTKLRGDWGDREESTPPYRPGERFDIQVLVTASCYLVSINGHYTSYSHRVPLDAVSVVAVKGIVHGVQIHRSVVRGYPQNTLKRQIL